MQDVCAFEDLVHGRTHPVRISGREIFLVRWDDRVFALRNICPHQSTALSGGAVTPGLSITGPFDDIEVQADRPVVACPWHGWIYDLTTGRCRTDGEIRVKAYPTEVVDGRVRVQV